MAKLLICFFNKEMYGHLYKCFGKYTIFKHLLRNSLEIVGLSIFLYQGSI